MILDKLLEFDPAGTTCNISSTTQDSTNVIDFGVGRDMGVGDDPTLKVVVWTGATAWTVGTSVSIGVWESADGTNWYESMRSGEILLAQLTANAKIWEASLARRPAKLEGAPPRYMKLIYTTVGAMATATLQAELTMDVQANVPYPAGINIAN